MNIKYIALIAACCVARIMVYSQHESNDNYHGEVIFKVKNAGMDVTGTINISDLQIRFDASDLGRSHVVATADPNTINTGIAFRDNHLRRSDYFDAVRYPTIRLHSKNFKKTGKYFEGNFDLTIKNVTKSVLIPFSIKDQHNTVTFSGSFVIRRSDFHLGEDSIILDELVTVYFSVSRKKVSGR